MNISTNIKKSKTILVTFFVAISLGLFSTSCGEGEGSFNLEIPGVVGPNVSLNEDSVLISAVFENIHIEGGLRYNIPEYPNSYIEISPDLQSMGTLMSVNLAIGDVLNEELDLLDPQRLPGGRPLPGVLSGALPAVAFSIQSFNNMAFYIGPEVFGIFLPVGLDMQGAIVTARYYIDGNRGGNISIIGEDANMENSGVLLMLDMKRKTKKYLAKIDKKYD